MTYQTVAAFTQSLSLLIFVSLFIGVVIYAVWPGNQKAFDRASRLPLENDPEPGREPNMHRDTGGRT
ncbi:MAG: cbb3-type cytochrome c oxidase subunit 3 [Alphaproteobacteria bacterium]|nr:cbb3-type cytochrome c oxidase subunit 3 [Alphaproteobacteria bacterium]